jgi:cyclic pyranopterin phosphate synthase
VIVRNPLVGVNPNWPRTAAAGLRVKINAVALKGVNEDELGHLVEWAHGRGMDLTVIEVMPLGDIGEERLAQYLPLSMVRARLAERFTLEEIDYRTGGPARYTRVKETGGRLGFITPLTHNFCESCNRVRGTCTGTLYMCLGQNDDADLRSPLRKSEGNEALYQAIDEAISRKPKGHDFIIDRRHRRPALVRHMSVTGGVKRSPKRAGSLPASHGLASADARRTWRRQ